MESRKSILSKSLYKYAFEIADTNGDGILSEDELDQIYSMPGLEVSKHVKTNFHRKLMDTNRGDLVGKCVFQVRFL